MAIRRWFEQQLITREGFRTQTLIPPESVVVLLIILIARRCIDRDQAVFKAAAGSPSNT